MRCVASIRRARTCAASGRAGYSPSPPRWASRAASRASAACRRRTARRTRPWARRRCARGGSRPGATARSGRPASRGRAAMAASAARSICVGRERTARGDLVDCAAPAVCQGSGDGEARCVVAAQLGAPCGVVSCARFDTFCDPVSQLCTLLPGPGEACGDSECVPYAQCRSGVPGALTGEDARTCVPRAGEGAACGYDGEMYVECRSPFQCVDGATCSSPAVESGAGVSGPRRGLRSSRRSCGAGVCCPWGHARAGARACPSGQARTIRRSGRSG
jgi:hypothetical protein